MKTYIVTYFRHNPQDSADAIEYVYDAHILSKEEFVAKYFG